MYILALDTTSNSLSVALNKNDKTIYEVTIAPNSSQSEILIPEIEKILTKHKISYQDLSLIAATNGPGSFTGSRIGLTTARTIRLATNIPLILLNCCQVIAFKHQEQLQPNKTIFVTLDARANEIFYATYKSFEEINQTTILPKITTIQNIQDFAPKEDFFLCGSATSLISPVLKPGNFQVSQENDVIEAKTLANMAFEMHKQNYQTTNLDPIYLRSPRITQRKK